MNDFYYERHALDTFPDITYDLYYYYYYYHHYIHRVIFCNVYTVVLLIIDTLII